MKLQSTQTKKRNSRFKIIAFVVVWALLLTILLTCILYQNRQISVNGTLAGKTASVRAQEAV